METFRVGFDEIEMFRETAAETFDEASVLAGKTTPVFFGSGVNNFGVQLLLDGFLAHSPPPKARVMAGAEISPIPRSLPVFIFCIQAAC